MCKCVLYYCHRVATQLYLTNISYHTTLHQYLYVTKTLQSIIWLRNLQTLCSSNVHQLGPKLTQFSPAHIYILRVRKYQQSQVESNPVRLTKSGSVSVAYNGRRGSAYSPAESSRVPRVLPSQESWCRMFHFPQTPVIGRDGRNRCKEAYSFSVGTRGNLRSLAL